MSAAWRLVILGKARLKSLTIFSPLDRPMAGMAAALDRIGPRLGPPPQTDLNLSISGGMSMVLPPGSPSFRQFAAGLYEPELTKLIGSLLQPGMTMVDLGAGAGYHTLMASQSVGESGRVFAFEPDPLMHEYLRRNVEMNHLANVQCIQKAVSNKVGTSAFARDEPERGHLSESGGAGYSASVETTTLDAFVDHKGWPSIDLMKIDVEGAEVAALDGMTELASRNPRLRLIVEFNLSAMRRAGSSPEALADALHRLGFSNTAVIERTSTGVPAGALPISHFVYNFMATKQEPTAAGNSRPSPSPLPRGGQD